MHDGLTTLFSLYAGEVRGRIAAKLGCGEDVDDLSQEVFLRAHRAMSCRIIEHPRAYLHQIANSVVTDHFRRGQRRCAPPSGVYPLDEQSQIGYGDATPEEQAIGEETWETLSTALGGLPPRAREAILLRTMENMSYLEVADHMGISVRTVEKHIARGLSNLRACVLDS